ncbi:hypothetical protein AAVH_20618 [Aphelenchoides avenae]|nr:hypothetical protein AAVH_20618 [Aphelenchus avenae]
MWARRTHAVNAVTFNAIITAAADTLALPDDYFEKTHNGLYFIDSFRRLERRIALGEPNIVEIISGRKNIVLHI